MGDFPLIKRLLENRRRIFGFIYALTRDLDTSEEVFQEVSLAVLEEATRQAEIRDFLPWAREVARLRVMEHYRKLGQTRSVSSSLIQAVERAFETNAESPEEASRKIRGLLACVQRLPSRQREIVELRYRDRKSVAEVAALVRWRVDAVKVALSKIRKSLRDCLLHGGLSMEADFP